MSWVQPPAQTQVTCEIRPNCSALFSWVLKTCKTETAELLWATTSTAWLNHVEEVLHPVWAFFTPTYDHWLLSSHHTAQKRALLHLLQGTSRLLLKSPWSIFCQTNSALRLSSQGKCSSSPNPPGGPPLNSLQFNQSSLYRGSQNWARYCRRGLMSPSREEPSLPSIHWLCCSYSLRCHWPFPAGAGSCWPTLSLLPTRTLGSFQQSCFPACQSPTCITAGCPSFPGAGLCICPVNSSWHSEQNLEFRMHSKAEIGEKTGRKKEKLRRKTTCTRCFCCISEQDILKSTNTTVLYKHFAVCAANTGKCKASKIGITQKGRGLLLSWRIQFSSGSSRANPLNEKRSFNGHSKLLT